jgi:hypothetical protein
MLPPSTISELAHEHFNDTPAMSRYATSQDPDGLFIYSTLQPDPAFVGLRAIISFRPVGALKRWVDRMIVARRERRYGTRIVRISERTVSSPRTRSLTIVPFDDYRDQDIAA